MQVLHELVAVRRELRADMSLETPPGRRRKALIAKSEDLPGMMLLSHESLAENMQIRMRTDVFCLCLSAQAFSLSVFQLGYGSIFVACAFHLPTRKNHTAMNNTSRHAISIKKLLGAALLVLLIAALSLVYATFREEAVSGSKAITLEVVNSAAESTTYSLKTDAEFLLGAMDEAEGLTFSGSEGPYGLMITTVNGETADYNVSGAYWSFTVNGEYCNYGAGEQPVEDGDAFVIAYTR